MAKACPPGRKRVRVKGHGVKGHRVKPHMRCQRLHIRRKKGSRKRKGAYGKCGPGKVWVKAKTKGKYKHKGYCKKK